MDYIMCFFNKYGVIAICIVILIEYACFPVSSEIILPFSGVIAYVNNMHIGMIIILSIIAGILGSSICYILGRIYGEKSLEWIQRIIPKSSSAIKKSKMFFDKYGKCAVMVGRVIPLCRTYISFVAGTFKQGYGEFVIFSVIGISIWNALLIFIGYTLGYKWEVVTSWYSKYKLIIFVIILVIIIGLFIKVNLKKNRREK